MASSFFKLFSQKCTLSNIICLSIPTNNRPVLGTVRSYSSRLYRTRHRSSLSVGGDGNRKHGELLATIRCVLEIDSSFHLDAKKSYILPKPPVLGSFLEEIDAIPNSIVHEDAEQVTLVLLRRVACIHSMVADFYEKNAEPNPLSKRKMLNWYQHETKELHELDFTPRREKFWAKGIIRNGPNVDKAKRILRDIKEANKDHLENAFTGDCRLVVIDPRLLPNVERKNQGAMATPDGVIWIDYQMVTEYSNDVLAATLGHEMAHNLLDHAAEVTSIDVALNLVMHHAFLSLSKYVAQNHQKNLKNVGLYMMRKIRNEFPGNTVQEAEADKYGMMLMSRCGKYNPDGLVELFQDAMDPNMTHKRFQGGFRNMIGDRYVSTGEKYIAEDLEELYEKRAEDRVSCFQPFKDVHEMVKMYSFQMKHPPFEIRKKYSEEKAQEIHLEKIYKTVREELLRRIPRVENSTD